MAKIDKDTLYADFLAEVRKVAYSHMLEHYVGDRRRIALLYHYQVKYCRVLGVRMAKIWGVTRGTANRRLQSMADMGIRREVRYGFSHCDSYHAPSAVVEQYMREARDHWLAVGYSETELLPVIKD